MDPIYHEYHGVCGNYMSWGGPFWNAHRKRTRWDCTCVMYVCACMVPKTLVVNSAVAESTALARLANGVSARRNEQLYRRVVVSAHTAHIKKHTKIFKTTPQISTQVPVHIHHHQRLHALSLEGAIPAGGNCLVHLLPPHFCKRRWSSRTQKGKKVPWLSVGDFYMETSKISLKGCQD